MNTSPDHWNVTLPYTIAFSPSGPGGSLEWSEGPVPANDVTFNIDVNGNSSTFSVFSDNPNPGPTPASDGHTFSGLGTDTTDQQTVNMTFNDNAAAAETTGVPETGSTLGLFVLALIALLGAKRLRSLRIA